ncbi:MAG: N-ATPase subunit AtpR [Thermoleophilia bacterium]
MVAVLEISLLAAGGAALGLFYFGGLWYTVRLLAQSRSPTMLVLGSYIGRLSISLAFFYLAVRGGAWDRLLTVMLAFLAVRVLLVRRLGPRRRDAASTATGG